MEIVKTLGYIKNKQGKFDICVVDNDGMGLWLATYDPIEDEIDTLAPIDSMGDAYSTANQLFQTQDEYVITASRNFRKFTKYPSNYVKSDSDIDWGDPLDMSPEQLAQEVDRLRRADLFKGRVPKRIQDRTIENMDRYHMGLSDAFKEACRELAPKGSELYFAWYYDDFRKFIPSAYDPQYLDFKKYPLQYVQSSTAIKASANPATYKMAGLRSVLRRFDSNGKYASSGPWHIANGGYDLDWELYYDNIPVVDCVAGELENCCLPDDVYNKVKSIIVSEYSDLQSSDVSSCTEPVKASTEDNEPDINDMVAYIDAEWDNCGCGEIGMSGDEAETYLGHSVENMTQDEIDEEVSEIQKAYYTSGEASDQEIIDKYNEMIGGKGQESIKASTEYTSTNPLRVDCPRGPYYVWEEFGKFKGSVNNPDAHIVDARKINTFDGFDSLDEVVEYVKKYF